jgi:hypothetical protein
LNHICESGFPRFSFMLANWNGGLLGGVMVPRPASLDESLAAADKNRLQLFVSPSSAPQSGKKGNPLAAHVSPGGYNRSVDENPYKSPAAAYEPAKPDDERLSLASVALALFAGALVSALLAACNELSVHRAPFPGLPERMTFLALAAMSGAGAGVLSIVRARKKMGQRPAVVAAIVGLAGGLTAFIGFEIAMNVL